MPVFIGRHIGETTLNGVEYLCTEENKTLSFDTEDAAKQFLREIGCKEEDIDTFLYIEEEEIEDEVEDAKQYAYPTEELAKESFIKRKKRQIALLSGQIERCRDALIAMGALKPKRSIFSINSVYNDLER